MDHSYWKYSKIFWDILQMEYGSGTHLIIPTFIGIICIGIICILTSLFVEQKELKILGENNPSSHLPDRELSGRIKSLL